MSKPIPPEDEYAKLTSSSHPVASAFGLTTFGIRKLRRLLGLPSLTATVRAQTKLERVFLLGFVASELASGLVPLIILRSVFFALISFASWSLFVMLAALPVVMLEAKRGFEPRGTYWDLTERRFRRDRTLGRAEVEKAPKGPPRDTDVASQH
ncbi:MAG: hypothetical protein WCF24_04755 [Acidimicrobiales bacterium]